MIFEKVREMLAKQFEMDAAEISKETDIMNELGADSLDLVELMMVLEDEYGITITDEQMYSLKTVGEIAEYLEAKM